MNVKLNKTRGPLKDMRTNCCALSCPFVKELTEMVMKAYANKTN